MPSAYQIKNNNPHFLTHTIVDWIDLFTRKELAHVVINSLQYCIENKGLVLYAWCLMPSHLHMIANCAKEEDSLSGIMRDFKKFTAKKLIEEIKAINESRRPWLLHHFTIRQGRHQVWQEGMQPIEIFSNKFVDQKLAYLHENPVNAGLVLEPEHYAYSSAVDYAYGKGGYLPVVFLD